MTTSIKLHIGGTEVKEGWMIFNIMPGPDVDIVGDCRDLSLFGDGTVDEVYASHVLEHLAMPDAIKAFGEIGRVLKPGGKFKGSVPDISVLFKLFLDLADEPEEQIKILFMVYGGHVNEFDIHHFGYTYALLQGMLIYASFSRVELVDLLNEFSDTSLLRFRDTLISLNFIATK